jgi:hypothetical protein
LQALQREQTALILFLALLPHQVAEAATHHKLALEVCLAALAVVRLAIHQIMPPAKEYLVKVTEGRLVQEPQERDLAAVAVVRELQHLMVLPVWVAMAGQV